MNSQLNKTNDIIQLHFHGSPRARLDLQHKGNTSACAGTKQEEELLFPVTIFR